jgi:transposase
MNEQLQLFHTLKVSKDAIDNKQINSVKRRVNSPVRNQVIMRCSSLDDLIPEDHRVRTIWDYVQQLDLSQIFKKIQVVEGGVGRSATDPYILLTLWLYATIEGIGSARVIERYCSEHIAFQWICGEVNVNYHTISDFRTKHKDELDELLTQSVAILMKRGMINLERVAQDGTRVRANAGSSSFRREKTLRECLKIAEQHLKSIQKDIDNNPSKHASQIEARRKRATEERKVNAEKAIEELHKYRKEIKKNKAGYTKAEVEKKVENARVSKTDCEARKMKMANSGIAAAYNVQFATDTKSQAIVGIDVINVGYDYGQITPMMNQVADRYGKIPDEWLADPGYRKIDDIEKAVALHEDCKIYVPAVKLKDNKVSLNESEVAKELRLRMETEEAKVIYKERASTAECVNAIAKNRGLQQFLVRGLEKVKCVALLFALTHNVMRGISLMSN